MSEETGLDLNKFVKATWFRRKTNNGGYCLLLGEGRLILKFTIEGRFKEILGNLCANSTEISYVIWLLAEFSIHSGGRRWVCSDIGLKISRYTSSFTSNSNSTFKHIYTHWKFYWTTHCVPYTDLYERDFFFPLISPASLCSIRDLKW